MRAGIAMLVGFVLGAFATALPVGAQEPLHETFEGIELGARAAVETAVGTVRCVDREVEVIAAPSRRPDDTRTLRAPAGRDVRLEIELSDEARSRAAFGLRVRRENRRRPFLLVARVEDASGRALRTVDLRRRVSSDAFEPVELSLEGDAARVALVWTSPERGIVVDDLVARPAAPIELVDASVETWTRPLVLGRRVNVARVVVAAQGTEDPPELVITGSPAGEMPAAVRLGEFAVSHWGGGYLDRREDGSSATPMEVGTRSYLVSVRVDAAEGSGQSAIGVPVPIAVHVAVDGRRVADARSETPGRTAVEIGGGAPFSGEAASQASTAFLGWRDTGRLLFASAPSTAETEIGLVPLTESDDGGRTWSSSTLIDFVDVEISGTSPAPTRRILGPALLRDPETDLVILLYGVETSGGPGTVLKLRESTDRGRSWTEPRTVALDLDERIRAIEPVGGRGVVTTAGRYAFPMIVQTNGTRGGEPRLALLESPNRGATWSLSPLGAITRHPAIAETGDDAILAIFEAASRARRGVAAIRPIDLHWNKRPAASEGLPCAGGAGALLHVGRELTGAADGRLVHAHAAVDRRPLRDMCVWGTNDGGGTRWEFDKRVLLDDGHGVAAPGLALVGDEVIGVLYRSSTETLVYQRISLDELVDEVPTFWSVTGGR